MPAFPSFFRIVGNFILLIAILTQSFRHIFIHTVFRILVRQFQFSFGKRCPLFNNKTVRRNMLRTNLCHCAQIFYPSFIALSRNSKHQIHVNIGKSSVPCHLIAFQKLCVIMDSSKHCQLFIIRRLQSQADPVNTVFSIKRQLLRSQGSRISFDRHLRIWFQTKALPYSLQQLFHHITFWYRRCTSPDKHSIHRTLFQ